MNDIFDPKASKAARDEAMGRADAHANEEWKDNMRACILDVARRQRFYNSDDVAKLAQQRGQWDGTHELRALGPLMQEPRRQGLCRKANKAPVPSIRAHVHRNYITVWESLIFKEPISFTGQEWEKIINANGIRDDQDRQGGPGAD